MVITDPGIDRGRVGGGEGIEASAVLRTISNPSDGRGAGTTGFAGAQSRVLPVNAHLYVFVVLLHVIADITFAGSLLVTSIALAALARESAQALPRQARLVAGLRGWNRWVAAPALVCAWLLGGWLAVTAGWFGAGWLSAKLSLVLVLSGLHGYSSRALRRLAATPPVAPPRRVWLLAPSIAVVAMAIVWLVLIKPF